MSRNNGFTLVEVMVALGIVAIALAAGSQAVRAMTQQGQRQADMVLAQICVENEIVKVRLTNRLPDIGERSTQCQQAGRSLVVTTNVSATANPGFRKLEVLVGDEYPIWRINTVVGQ